MILLFLLLATNFINFDYKNNHQNKNLTYSPSQCTVTNYYFTFLYDTNTNLFKVHGLWGEQCQECINCGYPSCCNIENINYVYPNDPTNFIEQNWFNTLTTEECTNKKNVILFEHEYYKHISCTNLKTTDEFLKLIIYLYNNYYKELVYNNCFGYKELWLNLDSNFMYNNVTKCM
jgi:hypothetical protein